MNCLIWIYWNSKVFQNQVLLFVYYLLSLEVQDRGFIKNDETIRQYSQSETNNNKGSKKKTSNISNFQKCESFQQARTMIRNSNSNVPLNIKIIIFVSFIRFFISVKKNLSYNISKSKYLNIPCWQLFHVWRRYICFKHSQLLHNLSHSVPWSQVTKQ